jgi:hypothetical protein
MLMKYDASDEEILAYYREHHDPYITLESAKKHWRYSMRWWHRAAARKRAEEARRRAVKLHKDLGAAICPPLGPPLQIAKPYAGSRSRRLPADDGPDLL